MCGIFGYLNLTGGQIENPERVLNSGIQLIQHRGPDSSATWVSENKKVGLAHCRLSIIDVENGSQPMTSGCGRFTIVFNGEIYNHAEIRLQIGEHLFSTKSDTEVIIMGYGKWGKDIVQKLRGMFAFAIWDNVEETLFVARDRVGIKPFYYTVVDDTFYFSSEMKGLMPLMAQVNICWNSMPEYFAYQFSVGSNTLIEGIHQIEPAYFALLKAKTNLNFVKYWDVRFDEKLAFDEDDISKKMDELLLESVELHLTSDVEVGGYVSGGIDSSLMAATASKVTRQKEFKIFNGRFLGEKYDESKYAIELAEHHGLKPYLVDISEQDFVDNIENIIWHLDQPTGGPGSFPQFMVSKEVGKNVKVVLGGQGGDEVFGGYARYLLVYLESALDMSISGRKPSSRHPFDINQISSGLTVLENYKPTLKSFWSKGLFETEAHRYFSVVNRSNNFRGVLCPELLEAKQIYENFREIYFASGTNNSSSFDAMCHFDFKTLLPALLQVEDRMSMAHGVEARVPLLDHKLIEFAAMVSSEIKFQNGELKRLLKNVSKSYLPDAILNRKDKMGFPVPLNDWLQKKGIARDFVQDLLGSHKARNRDYLTSKFSFDELLQERSPYGRNLWALLSLELWQKNYVDKNWIEKN